MFGKLSINPDEKSDPIIVPVNQKSFNIGNSKECDLRIDFSSIPNLLCTVKQLGKNKAALKICSNSVAVKLNNKTVLGEAKLSNEDVINAGPISLKWLYVDGSEQVSKSKPSAGLRKRYSEPVKQKKGAFAFSKRRTVGEVKNNETSKLTSSMKNSRFSVNKTHQKLKTSVKCMIKDLQSLSSKKKSSLSISINGDDSLPKSSTRRSLFSSQSGETLDKSVERKNGSIGQHKTPPTRNVRKQLEKALTLANVKLKTPRRSKNISFKSLSERPTRLSKEEKIKLREELLSVSSPTNNRAETPLSSKKLKSMQVPLSKKLEKLNKSLSFRNRPSVNDSVEVLVDSNSFPASSILETPSSSSVKRRSGRFSKSIDISGYIEKGGSPLLPNTSTPLTIRQSKKKILFGQSSPSLTTVQESEDGWISVISPNPHSSSKSKRLSRIKHDASLLKSLSDANISKSVKIEISDSFNLQYSSESINSNKKNKSVVFSTILDDNSKLINIKDSPNSPLLLNMSRLKSSDAILTENNQVSTSKFQMSTSLKKRNANEYNSHGAEDLISPRNKRKKMEKSEPDIFSSPLLNNSKSNISGRRSNLRSMNTPKSLSKINNIQNFKEKRNSGRKGKINERYASKENTPITIEMVSNSTPMKYRNDSLTKNISYSNVDETPLKNLSSVKSNYSMCDKRGEIVLTSLNETNISKGSPDRNVTPKYKFQSANNSQGVKSVEKNNSARSVTRSTKTNNESRNTRRSKSIETPTRASPASKIVTPVQRRSKSLEKLTKLEVSKTKSKTPISNKKIELNMSESLQKSTGRRGRPRKDEVVAPSKPVSPIVNETPLSIKKISKALSTGKSSKTNDTSLSKRISGVDMALSESQLSSIDSTSTSARKNKSLRSVGRRNTDKSKTIRRSKSIEVKTPSSNSGEDVTPVQRRSKSLETLSKLEKKSSSKILTPVQRRSKSLEKLTKLEVSKTKSKTPISNKKVELNMSESLQKSSGRRGRSRKDTIEALSKSVSLIDNKTPSNTRKVSNALSNSKSVKKGDKYTNRRSRSLEVSPSTLIKIDKSPVNSKRHSSVLDGSGVNSSAKLRNSAVNSPLSKSNLSSWDDSSAISRRSKSLDTLSNVQETSDKKSRLTISPKPETLHKSTGRSLPKRMVGEIKFSLSHSKVRDLSKSPKVTPDSVSLSRRTLTRSSVSKGSQSVKKPLKRKLISGESHDKYSPAAKIPKSDKKKVAAIIKCYGQKSPSYADILKKNLSEKKKNQAVVNNISQPSRKVLHLKHSVKSVPQLWSLNVPQKFNFTTSTGHVESPETIVIRRKDTPRPVIKKTRKGRKSTFVFVSGKDPNLSGIENLFHTPVKESSLLFKSVHEKEDYYSFSNEERLSSESPQEELLQALDLTRKCDLPPKPLPGPRRSRRLHPPYRKTPAKLPLSSHGRNSLNETIPSVKKNVSFLKGFERGRTPPCERTPRSRSCCLSPMKTPKSILKSSKQSQQSSSKGKVSPSKKIYLDPRLKRTPMKQINKSDSSLLNLSNKDVESSGIVNLTPKYRSTPAEKQDLKSGGESSKAGVIMVDKGTHTPDFSSGASSPHDNIISPRKQSPFKINDSEKQSPSSPKTIYTNAFGIKQLFNLPQQMHKLSSLTEKVDYTDVSGVRELFNGQKTSPVANYSNVSGIRELFSSPDKSKPIKANFNKVVGIRQLFNLPRVMRSAKSRQTSTDLLRSTPQSDTNLSMSENLSGLKELFSHNEESTLDIGKVRKLFLEDGKTVSGIDNTPPQPKEGAKGSRKRKQKGDSGLRNRVGPELSTSSDNLSSEIIDLTDEASSQVKQHRSTRKGKTNYSAVIKMQVSEDKLKPTEVKEKSPKNVHSNKKIKKKNLRHTDKEAEINKGPEKVIAVKKLNGDRPVEILDKKTRSGVQKMSNSKASNSKTKLMNYKNTIKDGQDTDKSKTIVKNKTIKQSHNDDTGAVDTKNIIPEESVRGSRRRNQDNSSSNTSKSSKKKLSADKKQMGGQHSVDRRKVKISDKKLDSSPVSTSKKSRSRSQKDESPSKVTLEDPPKTPALKIKKKEANNATENVSESSIKTRSLRSGRSKTVREPSGKKELSPEKGKQIKTINKVKKETGVSKITESPTPSRAKTNLRSKLLLKKGEVQPSNEKAISGTRSKKKATTKEEPAVTDAGDNKSTKITPASKSRKRKNVEQIENRGASVGKSDDSKKIGKTQKKIETETTDKSDKKVVRESRQGKKVASVKSVSLSPKATRSRSRVDPKPGTSKASGRDKSPKIILQSRSSSVTQKDKTRSHKRPVVSSPVEELPSPKKAKMADSKKSKMEVSGSKKGKSPRVLNKKKPVGTPSPKKPNLSLKKFNAKISQNEVSSPKIKSRTDLKKRKSITAVKKSTKSPVKRKGKTVSINTGAVMSRQLRRRK